MVKKKKSHDKEETVASYLKKSVRSHIASVALRMKLGIGSISIAIKMIAGCHVTDIRVVKSLVMNHDDVVGAISFGGTTTVLTKKITHAKILKYPIFSSLVYGRNVVLYVLS